MNCEKVRTLLGRFYDCNLDRYSEAGVESHLANCPSCGVEFERLQKLGGVLQKGFIPAPSVSLDELVMRDIRRESELRQSQKTTWRQRMFSGSVSVPKPAFAAALILIIAGLILSNLLGRNAANFIAAVPDAAPNSLPASAISPPPFQPNEPEKMKIVEVPVVRERIVRQVVYIKNQTADNRLRNRTSFNSRSDGLVRRKDFQKESPVRNQNLPDLKSSNYIAENGYFTKTDFGKFRPVGEMKTRIIKESKTDEK